MEVYRGISPFEIRAIRCSGFISSTDSKWVDDLLWRPSRTRTFFTRNKEQADLFAIGAYISGYGAAGNIIRHYLIGQKECLTSRSYTLQLDIPKSLLRTDTEFAESGDDELYTIEPVSIKYIKHIYIHRVWLSSIEDNRVFVISALTTELPYRQTLRLLPDSIELTTDSDLLPYQNPLQDRKFWLKVISDGKYVCVATLFDGILTRYETSNI